MKEHLNSVIGVVTGRTQVSLNIMLKSSDESHLTKFIDD